MPHPDHPTLTVVDHPLIQHKLARLRDRETGFTEFRRLAGQIATLMTLEATRDLPTGEVSVMTPLETMAGRSLACRPVLVPILRAGLGMVDGILQLIPEARVGHIGLYRDHATLEPVSYYFKLPPDPAEVLLLDPMLATGGSAAAAVAGLKAAGAGRIRLLCLVAAPEGVDALGAAHPDVPVFAAALDRELNGQGYIVPGLGDAGDRLFGTE